VGKGSNQLATSSRAEIIDGSLHVDDRGSLAFFNNFAFRGIERFYIIRPAKPKAVRGWVGHRREQKWFTAVAGVLAIAVVRPDDWQSPSSQLPVSSFILTAEVPRILSVPPGYATAILAINPRSALMVFSTGKIEDAVSDTFRFPTDLWEIPEQLGGARTSFRS
jgi:dTDP-4-dehydrorhamnose 3,5-epimerase-like enzyme